MSIIFKDSPDKLFIGIENSETHVVHIFVEDSMRFNGVVYPITYWQNTITKESGWSYDSNLVGGETYDNLNSDCSVLFEFNFCWRGVWEGRIYFPNDAEYWSEDLKIIDNVWDQIEINLKQRIKLLNTDYDGFDD